MHRSILSAVAILFPLGIASAQQPSCAARLDSSSTSLDSAIVAAMRTHAVPGAALAIVTDGRVEHLTGYGCADIENGVRVDPRTTVFHIASVSKPFVALAAVQLAARGAIDLRADVNQYLHGMQVPAGWNRPIAMHDLLTHTSGLEESVVGYAARTPAEVRPLGEFLAEKLPRRGWAPGDVTGYSNYGYALAGYVVESVTKTSFADYVRNEIFTPLGMSRSSFAQPMPPELARDAAVSYRCSATNCTRIEPDYRSAYPPGGVVTTAQDMSRFILAELGDTLDGKRVLSDSLLSLTHTRQFTHDPALAGETYGFSEGQLAGDRSLSHAGGASGYTSFVLLVPGRRFGAFIVANGGASRFGAAALSAIESRFLPARAETPAVPVAPVGAVDPTGSYRLTRYAHHGIVNLPALFAFQLHVNQVARDTIDVTGLGDANGRYVAVAENRWRKVDGSDMVAVRMRDGQVTHFFGSSSFFGSRFPAAYERLAWFDEPHFLNEALSYVIAIPALAILAWPIVAGIVSLVRRRRRLTFRVRPAGNRSRGVAAAAAVAFTALAMWFGFGFIAVSNRAVNSGGGDIIYGLPTAMRVLSWAPLVITLLTCLLVAATLVGWKRRWWSVPSLVLFTLITTNAVLFVALLVRWGYFPVVTS